MQRQTVVAEASLPSGKQGDRGPERPDASNKHTDVRASSPRKDPQSQSKRDTLIQQRDSQEEADAIFQRESITTAAKQDTMMNMDSGDRLPLLKTLIATIQSSKPECANDQYYWDNSSPDSVKNRESADASLNGAIPKAANDSDSNARNR